MILDIKNKFPNNILFFLLAFLCSYSIMPNAIQSIIVLTFSSLAVFINWKHIKEEILKRGITNWVIIIGWIFVLGISIFYSIEFKAGFIELQKLLSIIVLPFVILYCFPSLNIRKIEILMIVFVLSNFLYGIYLIFYLFDNISILLSQTNISINNYSEFIWYGINEGYKPFILIHKTYFSMSMLLSLIILIWFFVNKNLTSIQKTAIISLAIFFGGIVVFFLSKINMFLMLILPFFLFLKNMSKKRKVLFGIQYVLVFMSLLIIVSILFNKYNKDSYLSNNINSKVQFIKNIFAPTSIKEGELDKRAIIYECARKLIKERPFFGYGIGAQHIYLTGCYASKKEFGLYQESFNSHNYYYFVMLSGGVFAMFFFLIMIFFLLRLAYINKNVLLFLFLIIIFSNQLIENTFSRINGVLLFAVMLPIIIRFKENKQVLEWK